MAGVIKTDKAWTEVLLRCSSQNSVDNCTDAYKTGNRRASSHRIIENQENKTFLIFNNNQNSKNQTICFKQVGPQTKISFVECSCSLLISQLSWALSRLYSFLFGFLTIWFSGFIQCFMTIELVFSPLDFFFFSLASVDFGIPPSLAMPPFCT